MATLPAATRFSMPGISKVYFLPAIAATNMVPTRAEITAGTDLSGEVADMSGFMVTGGTIPTPDLASEFTSTIPGRTSAGDSSITFYGSETGSDVRTVLPRNTVGFLLFADQGDASGKKADVYPIRVLSVGKMRSTGDEPYRIQIGFSITREPAEDIALPA